MNSLETRVKVAEFCRVLANHSVTTSSCVGEAKGGLPAQLSKVHVKQTNKQTNQKYMSAGISLEVQWLTLCASTEGAQVQSLVRDLSMYGAIRMESTQVNFCSTCCGLLCTVDIILLGQIRRRCEFHKGLFWRAYHRYLRRIF